MKMVAGLIEPSSGEIFFDGRLLRGDWMAFRQRMGMCLKSRTCIRT
jgi:ABC-type multidrug transport system ATPase subunit